MTDWLTGWLVGIFTTGWPSPPPLTHYSYLFYCFSYFSSLPRTHYLLLLPTSFPSSFLLLLLLQLLSSTSSSSNPLLHSSCTWFCTPRLIAYNQMQHEKSRRQVGELKKKVNSDYLSVCRRGCSVFSAQLHFICIPLRLEEQFNWWHDQHPLVKTATNVLMFYHRLWGRGVHLHIW